jgi:3-hydroxymyristoyl/3-hydroxydecanoyl-(acyl carrier protein) dehydratase
MGARPVEPPLPQAPPFRFVDAVLERVSPDSCATATLFSPGHPLLRGTDLVPASLVLEALCQSAACLPGEGGAEGRILRVDEAVFPGEVRVGDRMEARARIREAGETALSVEIVGRVDGREVARCRVLIARTRGEGPLNGGAEPAPRASAGPPGSASSR